MAAALAAERADLEEPAHRFLEEERVALRSLEEEPLERVEGRVGAEQRAEQFVGALPAEGIDPELAVIRRLPQACWYSGR
jgi:hypothetical protein